MPVEKLADMIERMMKREKARREDQERRRLATMNKLLAEFNRSRRPDPDDPNLN